MKVLTEREALSAVFGTQEAIKISGIKERTLRYCIERGMLGPAGKTLTPKNLGHWRFSPADVFILGVVAMLQRVRIPPSVVFEVTGLQERLIDVLTDREALDGDPFNILILPPPPQWVLTNKKIFIGFHGDVPFVVLPLDGLFDRVMGALGHPGGRSK